MIFDHIFKKMLSLSSKAVTNMINGLFGYEYDPENTTIDYHWTEHQADETLKTTLADTILILNNKDAYHMEAQITEDKEIIFRIFSYGYGYADMNKETIASDDAKLPKFILHFPNPCIIFLGDVSSNVPGEYSLELDFWNDKSHTYTVPTVKLADISVKELNDRKMVILIPFHMLKLRKLMKTNRGPSTIQSLKNLVQTDILGSIETNLQLGNITQSDAHQLMGLAKKLYAYLYEAYTETEEVCDMFDQSLELETDELATKMRILEDEVKKYKNIEKALAEKESALGKIESVLAERDSALAEKDSALAEKDSALAEKDSALAEKDSALADIQAENERLKAEIARLSAK